MEIRPEADRPVQGQAHLRSGRCDRRYLHLREAHKLSQGSACVVIKYEEESTVPGSAGNTINNLLALGATSSLSPA